MDNILTPYLLPDNRIVMIQSEVARGAFFVSFTLNGGEVVQAMRWDGQVDGDRPVVESSQMWDRR